MLLAVVSDIHDRVSNLKAVLARLESRFPALLICCGDITTPPTLAALAGFAGPVHFCLGNCDAAQARSLLATCKQYPNLVAARHFGSLDLADGSGRVGFCHFPEAAHERALSGHYKAVFYGHTHRAAAEELAVQGAEQTHGRTCLFANPGDIQGRFGNAPGGLLWNSVGGQWEWVR